MQVEWVEKLVREAFQIEDIKYGYKPNVEWREYLIKDMLPLFTIFAELVETEVNERWTINN